MIEQCGCKSPKLFAGICAEDGIDATKRFRAYLVLKDKVQEAKAEADQYLKDNPGSSRVPARLAVKIKNAQTAWKSGGQKNQIEIEVEKIRRKSRSCH